MSARMLLVVMLVVLWAVIALAFLTVSMADSGVGVDMGGSRADAQLYTAMNGGR